MKSKIISALFLLAACVATPAFANEAPAPKEESVIDLQIIVQRIEAKLQSGAETEDAIQTELKRLDALVVSDKAVAFEVCKLKGRIMMEAFNNLDKAEQYFNQAKLLTKDVEAKNQIEDILNSIAKQRDAARIQATLKPGTEPADFQVKDIMGRKISLSKFKGLVVLVDFWATWCGPCVEDMPTIAELNNKYQSKGLQIIGISLDEKDSDVKEFAKKNGMFWTQICDGKGWETELALKYGVTGIPFTMLIDREGKIVATGLRGAELEAAVKKLFAK